VLSLPPNGRRVAIALGDKVYAPAPISDLTASYGRMHVAAPVAR